MTTINVSIPEKLKSQAQELVERGFYASFSDVVRDALRQTLANNKYDLWADEAARDLKEDKVKDKYENILILCEFGKCTKSYFQKDLKRTYVDF